MEVDIVDQKQAYLEESLKYLGNAVKAFNSDKYKFVLLDLLTLN